MSNGQEMRDGRDDGGAAAPSAASAGGSDYLTVAQAAAILNCSKKQVQRLIKAGRIPAIDLGVGRQRSYRVRRVDLEVGLAVPPPAAPTRPRRRKLAGVRFVEAII